MNDCSAGGCPAIPNQPLPACGALSENKHSQADQFCVEQAGAGWLAQPLLTLCIIWHTAASRTNYVPLAQVLVDPIVSSMARSPGLSLAWWSCWSVWEITAASLTVRTGRIASITSLLVTEHIAKALTTRTLLCNAAHDLGTIMGSQANAIAGSFGIKLNH